MPYERILMVENNLKIMLHNFHYVNELKKNVNYKDENNFLNYAAI